MFSRVATAQPSSLGTNVCTTFVAQEIRGLAHCREALGSARPPPATAIGSGTWLGLESTIKLRETKKVLQYCSRGSFVFLPRTFHPLRAKRQTGRHTGWSVNDVQLETRPGWFPAKSTKSKCISSLYPVYFSVRNSGGYATVHH